MAKAVTKYTLTKVANVPYAFTMIDNQLHVRQMNRSTWYEAFRFFREMYNGSSYFDDTMYDIIRQIAPSYKIP